MLILRGMFFCFLMIWSMWSAAELYRWTDENGKVHYSDRKPATENQAEQIDGTLKPVNVDDSRHERERLSNVFPDRQDNTQQQEISQKKARQKERQVQSCEEAKEYLRKIKGPVYFVDKDGNEYDISERERRERQITLEQFIGENC